MPSPSAELLERIERCILALERDGEDALSAELGAAGPLAAEVRHHVDALRAANLLHPPEQPERIGTWRISRRLGSGGMGSVFLGEQQEPIARRAAIKVIRSGMDTHEVLARFAIERQTLALLDHPSIARILDAGLTPQGRPFLVMDYVAGQPIRTYCDDRRLDTRARLELFAKVCDAVQYAHQKGILHRDLKPSNLLVTDRDGSPFPVVIDFGVAKSVGARLGQTMLTMPGTLLGTPEYMSPEQAANDVDLDTRTDVYSLGVTLYELLTDSLPIDATTLRRRGVGEVLQAEEPPTPSTRITKLGDGATTVAANRRTSVGALRRSLRGELDWVVMKALERDRNRRYGMPGELAADLRRFLANEPVTAAAPSAWYRWRKFCARNRLQVGAAAIVLLALAAGLVTSITFYRGALTSEGTATRSLDAALQAVGELVQVGDSDLVAVPHLDHVRRDLLQRAVAFYRDFLAHDSADDPRLLARTLDATWRLGNMQSQLGEVDAALQTLAEIERLLATPAAATLADEVRQRSLADGLVEQARLLERRGDAPAANARVARALPILRELAADGAAADELRLGRALATAAGLMVDRDPKQALALVDEAIAIRGRNPESADDAEALVTRLRLDGDRANFLRLLGRRDEAIATVEAALAVRATHPARDTWQAAHAALRLGNVLESCERPDDVIRLCDQVEPLFTKLVADHPSLVNYRRALLAAMNQRSNAQLRQRDTAAALRTQHRIEEVCETGLQLAPDEFLLQRQLLIAHVNVVTIWDERRRIVGEWNRDEVATALAKAEATIARMPPGWARREVRPHQLELLRLRALQHEARGDLEAAEADLVAACAIVDALIHEAPDTTEWRVRALEVQRRLAAVQLDAGKAAAALPLAEKTLADSLALRDRVDAQGRWHARTRELMLLVVRARGGTGDTAGALAALDDHQEMGPEGNPDTMDWIGKQEAVQALTKLIAALPPTSADRGRFLAEGRRVLAEGLAFGERYLEGGQNPAMVAVMRGNSLVVAHQLEEAAGDLTAAAARAGEAAAAFALPWQGSSSARNETRLRSAAATWLQALHRADDAAGLANATPQVLAWFAERPLVLAELAATTAAERPDVAVQLLRFARGAGLPTEALRDARYASLRDRPDFAALAAESGKQ